ncbi:hypothetical protein ACP4TB_24580 [Streptomyces sp. DR3-1]|uniref:hypothetical protein n=1 Tax=Streptomyces sp. DR3-1 TaxID=2951169 RepID=UPI0020443595|nr:hypothetical protein [Streptomyces sp. DR3-1]
MNIIDLAPGDPRLTTDALPVLTELRPTSPPASWRTSTPPAIRRASASPPSTT